MPLAFRIEGHSFVVIFRYGVVVLFGMTPLQEDQIIQSLAGRIIGRYTRREQETTQIEIAPDKDEQIALSGTISLKALLPEHVLIIADAIATNVILARDERNVSAVFDVIEPLARELADHGRTPGGRRTILKHIGNALLVQQRVSGLVAVAEKPDVLWERPDLERFYARLEDEYELKERGTKQAASSSTDQGGGKRRVSGIRLTCLNIYGPGADTETVPDARSDNLSVSH